MSQLRSYLIVTVLKGVGLVLLAIVLVGSVIEFVGQLDDVGTADYDMATAISYVLLRIPRMVFEVLPAAAFVGALFGLGNLAVHRELIVMRASGISHFRMLGALALAGFGLMVLMVLLGESLAPSLSAYARELRTASLHEDIDLERGQSIWLKDGNRIISLRRPSQGIGFGGGVSLFELDASQQVTMVAKADMADIGPTNEWLLSNYAETVFSPDRVRASRAAELRPTYDISPDLLSLSVVREDLLDIFALQRYIAYLRANDLDARRYLIAYWARLANVASVALMTVLALPFVFGGLRSAGTGARLVVGLVVGLSYYVVVQVAARSGQVFDVDPIVVAWAPSAVLLAIVTIALLRVR
jgi:lipopolysaccharide export system permease protein